MILGIRYFLKKVVSRHAYEGDKSVVDTGAANNIVHSVALLTTITFVKRCVVELPNGEIAMLTLIGSVRISVHLFLENVLRVPTFSFNFLYLSLLTQKLLCCLVKLSNFCFI